MKSNPIARKELQIWGVMAILNVIQNLVPQNKDFVFSYKILTGKQFAK